MKIKLNRNKDFFAGLLFFFFGIATIWIAQDYHMGTSRRMGPAYFPSIIGGILTILGLVISVRSHWGNSESVHLTTLRPLIMIICAVAGFALLLQPLGLVLALFVLVLISSLADVKFRLLEFSILYIVLVLMAIILFSYGLGLQFPIWPI